MVFWKAFHSFNKVNVKGTDMTILVVNETGIFPGYGHEAFPYFRCNLFKRNHYPRFIRMLKLFYSGPQVILCHPGIDCQTIDWGLTFQVE